MKILLSLVLSLVSISARAQTGSCPSLAGEYVNGIATISIVQTACTNLTITTSLGGQPFVQNIVTDGKTEVPESDSPGTLQVYAYGVETLDANTPALIGHYFAIDPSGSRIALPGNFHSSIYLNAQGQLVIAQFAEDQGSVVVHTHYEFNRK